MAATKRTAKTAKAPQSKAKAAKAAKAVVAPVRALPLADTELLNADTALSALRDGWVVRRVGLDNSLAKFTRFTQERGFETAADEKDALNGVWTRAQTDIQSFFASRYLLVSDIDFISYTVNYAPGPLTGSTALRLIYGEKVTGVYHAFQIVASIVEKGERDFFKVEDGVLLQATGEQAMVNGQWTPSTVPVTTFMASTAQFQGIREWAPTGAEAVYAPLAALNDRGSRRFTATSASKAVKPLRT